MLDYWDPPNARRSAPLIDGAGVGSRVGAGRRQRRRLRRSSRASRPRRPIRLSSGSDRRAAADDAGDGSAALGGVVGQRRRSRRMVIGTVSMIGGNPA